VTDEQEHTVNCMAEGCALVAPDSFLTSVLTSSEDSAQQAADRVTLERFRELVIRHFVGCNVNLKFCPYPSCTNTVSCPAANTKSSLSTMVPIVSCGARGTPVESSTQSKEEAEELQRLKGKEHIFCFGCPIDSDHRPIVCAVAKLWLKKCADDSETANWIKSNTKECTACNSTIEKNGGCKCVFLPVYAICVYYSFRFSTAT
jgi:ariadne-1